MQGIKVARENAEKARRLLGVRISANHKVRREGKYVFLPLSSCPEGSELSALRPIGARMVEAKFGRRDERKSYNQILSTLGKKGEIKSKGYDLFGNIAVIDVQPKFARKAAEALMESGSSIRTVLRKGGAVKGRFRTRKFFYVAGERNYITLYKENGCTFKFDVRSVFFSTRLAYERKRISELVTPNEKIIVMFAGVGPYAIEIARAHSRCTVVAIELNKAACRYMIENVELNKVKNVIPVQGDVRRAAVKYRGFADRIVMPLPKTASTFLEEVLICAKSRCTVHYYAFCKAGREEETIDKIRQFFVSHKKKFRVLAKRIVRPYSAREIEIVVDFLIW